jgi:hypothetical protein
METNNCLKILTLKTNLNFMMHHRDRSSPKLDGTYIISYRYLGVYRYCAVYLLIKNDGLPESINFVFSPYEALIWYRYFT